jgi:hypothetical protein
MNKNYEVHTYLELKVASYIQAGSKEEAIALTAEFIDADFLKQKVLDISRIDIHSAFLAND